MAMTKLKNIQRAIGKIQTRIDQLSRANTITNFDPEGRDMFLLLSNDKQAIVKPGKNYSTPPEQHICKVRYQGSSKWRKLA